MGITDQAAKVASGAVSALQATPLALSLVFINLIFIGFTLYILGQVAANASVREKGQVELISGLIKDIRDCRQGPK